MAPDFSSRRRFGLHMQKSGKGWPLPPIRWPEPFGRSAPRGTPEKPPYRIWLADRLDNLNG